MWKDRSQFPILAKLEGYQFDAARLLADFHALSKTHRFNGLMAEYDGLCKTHNKLPKFFMDGEHCPDETAPYSQLALSEFDESYSLEARTERSGSLWDFMHPKRDKIADERYYRKPIAGLPSYLESVLSDFRPYLHRCRFAKLDAGAEVRPHIDYDTTYGVRLHIAIQTNDGCVNGGRAKNGQEEERHIPADGSVWFVNQGVKHWAKNFGQSERIHLIMSLDSQQPIAHLAAREQSQTLATDEPLALQL